MEKNKLKDLLDEFKDDLRFDYDLKKKIGLILVVSQKFFLKQVILNH